MGGTLIALISPASIILVTVDRDIPSRPPAASGGRNCARERMLTTSPFSRALST